MTSLQIGVLILGLLMLTFLVVSRFKSQESESLDADDARKYIKRAYFGGALLSIPFVVLVVANLRTINAIGLASPVVAFYFGWASYWGLHRWFLFLGQGLAESEGIKKFAYLFLLASLGPWFGIAYGVPGGGLYEWVKCRRALKAPIVAV